MCLLRLEDIKAFLRTTFALNCLACKGRPARPKAVKRTRIRTAAFACRLARTKNTCKARQGGKTWSGHCTLSSLLSAMRAPHRAAYRNASVATRPSGCSHWLHNADRGSCQNSCRGKAASGSVEFFWSMWGNDLAAAIMSHSYSFIHSLDLKGRWGQP